MSASIPGGDSPSSPSPDSRNLQQQRKQAKDLLKAARAGDAEAIARLRATVEDIGAAQLADAQLAIAREAGFDSWPKLVHELEKLELQLAAAALHRGDAQALRKILSVSPSVRRKVNEPLGSFGSRPVQMAAGKRDVLDVLIEFGADINLRSEWANGPFGVLDYCDEDTARHLIEKRGAILTAHAAARLGWLPELKRLVEAIPKVVHEKGGDGQRPLHFAKTVEIAGYLLERGADIDAQCVDHHSTAAQYALAERPEVCRFLLDRGALPDIFMAARLGDEALASRLIQGDPKCVSARVNWPDYARVPVFNIYCWTLGFHESPRGVAAKYGHPRMVDLLDAKSPPVLRLVNAAWDGDAEAAARAIESSPNVLSELGVRDHGMLAHAAHHQRDAAVKLMLKLGFDPSAGGTDGGTALHQAAWVGRADYVELLLPKSAAFLNQPDPTHKSTPLGWASYGSVHRCNEKGDYIRTIELLASAGGDVKRPGLVQAAEGNPRVQEVLRSLGAA